MEAEWIKKKYSYYLIDQKKIGNWFEGYECTDRGRNNRYNSYNKFFQPEPNFQTNKEVYLRNIKVKKTYDPKHGYNK